MKSALDVLREMRDAPPTEATEQSYDVADAVLEQREDAIAWRLYSRLLGRELWLARDERSAADLVAEGTDLPVLLLAEVPRLAGKTPELLRAVLNVRKASPGSRWLQ